MTFRDARDLVFGARAQVVVGVGSFVVGLLAWGLGTFVIPGALAWPWRWAPVAYVFHVSMFYGEVACWSIVTAGLGYKAVEKVSTEVVEEIKHADEVDVRLEQ